MRLVGLLRAFFLDLGGVGVGEVVGWSWAGWTALRESLMEAGLKVGSVAFCEASQVL